MNSETPNHEIKALGADGHDAHEVRHALNELMRAFEAFKEANNDRLAQIDRRLSADVVTEDKIHRLNETMDTHQKMLDDFAIAQQRPALDSYVGSAEREHKAAFDSYLRKGITSGLDSFESKALSTATDSAGGYVVPETVMLAVTDRLASASPFRRLATVQQVSTTSFKKVLTASGPDVRWAMSESNDGTIGNPDGSFAERAFNFGRLVATPVATQSLLDDSAIDLEKWLADEIYIGFAEKEAEAFVKGDSSPPSPKGFLQEAIAAQGDSLTNSQIGYIPTGKSADWPLDGADGGGRMAKLLEVVYALKAAYRTQASWLMNKTSIAVVRSWTDAEGNALWQPPTQLGASATLLDYPVAEVEDMPNKNTSGLAYPLAFGNWQRGYLIADRMDMRILRDPYSSKPNVVFYTTKTLGGGVMEHSAIKLLKCSVN